MSADCQPQGASLLITTSSWRIRHGLDRRIARHSSSDTSDQKGYRILRVPRRARTSTMAGPDGNNGRRWRLRSLRCLRSLRSLRPPQPFPQVGKAESRQGDTWTLAERVERPPRADRRLCNRNKRAELRANDAFRLLATLRP